MISLRLRLALLLVAAMIAVVGASILVIIFVDKGPEDGSGRAAFVRTAHSLSELLGGSAERARGAGFAVGPGPSPASVDGELTRDLATAQAEGRIAGPSLVVATQGTRRDVAFRLSGDDWVYLPFRARPPSPKFTLFVYLCLVAGGTIVVALLAANRILGPLRMLERALGSVRPDGTLPQLPEGQGLPEVRATARVLNALSGRLRTAMEGRMRLVAAAGHDLRTPMTRLRLRAEFLPEGERETWLRDLDELDHIADSAIRLVREEVDHATFEPCALGRMAAVVVRELGETGLAARMDEGPDPLVRVQPLATKRALRNLVENAARHGGGASVRVEAGDGVAVVSIEDRGPGIPEALLTQVFEPFFRVDAARRKSQPGAGLGLAIAREIIERQGGHLSIRNREGGGLHQEVRLPRPA